MMNCIKEASIAKQHRGLFDRTEKPKINF